MVKFCCLETRTCKVSLRFKGHGVLMLSVTWLEGHGVLPVIPEVDVPQISEDSRAGWYIVFTYRIWRKMAYVCSILVLAVCNWTRVCMTSHALRNDLSEVKAGIWLASCAFLRAWTWVFPVWGLHLMLRWLWRQRTPSIVALLRHISKENYENVTTRPPQYSMSLY